MIFYNNIFLALWSEIRQVVFFYQSTYHILVQGYDKLVKIFPFSKKCYNPHSQAFVGSEHARIKKEGYKKIA